MTVAFNESNAVKSTTSVRAFQAEDASAWEAYVEQNSAATFFHRHEWAQVLREAFGHKPHFLLALRAEKIVGILPLAETNSFLFGRSLSSSPFCVYGGIAADDADAETALREAACALAETMQVPALEFRNTKASAAGWETKDLYYTFRKAITSDNEANLKAIPNRQRAMVRKGIKAGLISEETEDLSRLYRVYSESVRNLGTPVFSRRYFAVLQRIFGSDCRTLMIVHEGRDVAGVMSFYHKGEVLPYYGGSIAAAREIKGSNDFMYWELLRRSADEGLTGFDFGRSKIDTGPFKFKKNWGFEPTPLPYEYYLISADELPNLSPTNPKYRLMIDTWKRLPLSLANMIGPFVAKYLG